MDLTNIQTKYYAERSTYPEPFRLRVHRALSWFKRAEILLADGMNELHTIQNSNVPHGKTRLSSMAGVALEKTETDWDLGFVSLWIAFNAIYARDLNLLRTAQDRIDFRQFLSMICRLDKDKSVYNLVWRVFSSDIRALVNNRYVFQPFWDFHNGLIVQSEFDQYFQASKKRVNEALAEQDTQTLLEIVFDRLYTLRNQIVHGGATWNSSANRKQVKSAYTFLNQILPVFLHIMMNNSHDETWGKPFYPFVKED